jgi:putative oxygen-independent coproporphyrinogen III oxidase
VSEPHAAPDAPVTPEDAAVYVHFPYCAKKCPYCDFNSHVLAHDDRAYADAVLAELAARGDSLVVPARGLSSVFFGGGTPSRWAPAEVGRVLRALKERFGFAEHCEVTLEANPGTVAAERFAAYVEQGVTRFSIGAQSFIDAELEELGRIHDARAAERAVQAAQATGARVSLDLMYAFPGQGWAEVERSLSRALALGTEHVSAYTLTVEPDTVLGRRTRLGLFVPMDDDRQAELIEAVSARFADAGLSRYEISNYARPGAESRHNALYWVGGAYLGLGAGAHGYLPGPALSGARRYENVKPPADYLEGARRGEFPRRFEEQLSRRQALGDRLMVAFRGAWGLDVAALAAEAGLSGRLEPELLPTLEALERQGLLRRAGPSPTRFVPTPRGMLFNDALARALLLRARELPEAFDGANPRA